MAPAVLVRVIGVAAIGFGLIIGSAATAATLAQTAPPAAHAAPTAPTDVAVTVGADGITPTRTALMAGQPPLRRRQHRSTPQPFVLEPAGANTTPLTAGSTQAKADGIAPGQTTTLAWTFPEPGDFHIAESTVPPGPSPG